MTEGELLTADFFKRAGEAAYGRRWSGILARAITCNGRLIRFYSTSKRAIPVEVWRKLSIHYRAAGYAMIRISERIDRALPPVQVRTDQPTE